MLLPSKKNQFNYPTFLRNFWDDDFLTNYFSSEDWADMPSVNIIENKEQFKIEVAAPGLEKADFKIKTEKNTLEISAEKETKKENKEKDKYLRREFGYTSFRRMFSLPQDAEMDKISATHKNGILEIIIPRKSNTHEVTSREIKIE